MHNRPIIYTLMVGLSLYTAPTVFGQNADGSVISLTASVTAQSTRDEIENCVKIFDFDERKFGYYEDVPMHWEQLRGPGLPALYAKGQFDFNVGHVAPPSFRLEIASGNVAYEYRNLDLMVVPDSDYIVRGFIKAENLNHAGALVAAYLIDRFGEPIAGSQRISHVTRAKGIDPEPWQPVEIEVSGRFPQAYALRLQFWILQDYVWRRPDPDEAEPILRRDIYVKAWFDDFTVHRFPRIIMSATNPAGVFQPGQPASLSLEASNATSQTLYLELTVRDENGIVRHVKKLEIPPISPARAFDQFARADEAISIQPRLVAGNAPAAPASALQVPLPDLPAGNYAADLDVLAGDRTMLKRHANFTVLPRLPVDTRRHFEFGVDLGTWRRGDVAGLRDALLSLGCGAVKIGVPMNGVIDGPDAVEYYNHLTALVRALAEQRIEVAGVMAAPTLQDARQGRQTVRELLTRGSAWRELCGPIFEHFGLLLPTWQLGSEAELQNIVAGWGFEEIQLLRDCLRGYISIPKIIVPRSITAPSSDGGDVTSIYVPPTFPTSMLPRALEFLADNSAGTSYWLQIGLDHGDALTPERRLADLARRVVIAKSLSPGRIYLPVPMKLSDEGGRASWQPTSEFIACRTLFHFLAGKTAVAAMTPTPDAVLIVFQGPDSSCLVVWSCNEESSERPLSMYLGPRPRAMTLGGAELELPVRDGRASIPIGPTPLILYSVNLPLTMFQTGYRVRPTHIQMHEPDTPPVLTFRNTYESQLSGEVRLVPPSNWRVEPALVNFVLEPGETFSQPLAFALPSRPVARPHELGVIFELQSPMRETLSFTEPLQLGLREIDLQVSLYWDGTDLIVRQTLRNLSGQTVNFSAYCEPIACARQERFFRDVAPGGVAEHTYLFNDARNLAGTLLPFGIDEIGGSRSLIQFAEVPQ